jgi:hypothetical protein
MRRTIARLAGLACGAIVAMLLLLAVPAAAQGAPAIAVSPTTGPVGTNFTVTFTGFTPGSTVAVALSTETSPPQTVAIPEVRLDAEGGFTLAISSLLLTPGRYIVAVTQGGATLATTRFSVTSLPATATRVVTRTVVATPPTAPMVMPTFPPPAATATPTAGRMPGMPATGDGRVAQSEFAGPVLTGLSLVAVSLAVVIVARRRAQR